MNNLRNVKILLKASLMKDPEVQMHVKHNKKNLIQLDESDDKEEEISPRFIRSLTNMMSQKLEGRDKLKNIINLVSNGAPVNQNESVESHLVSEEEEKEWGKLAKPTSPNPI